MVKSSDTGGVKPMTIIGRLVRERERLAGMTDDERALRAQYLKDQILSPNEPRNVPELTRELRNPIKRFYRYPLDNFQKMIEPKVGVDAAFHIRYFTGKILLGIFAVYCVTYYLKYNPNDWTRKGGFSIITSRPVVLPGDTNYPKLSDKSKPEHYASRGFENNTLNL
ncbi:hypothetical protein WA026_017182 [Henosepilachna vigintioctopunctata]|uniref:NADH dehydrogenase [ubiquinone] 1 beta subcomplex subunit 6 n=1 Tax=Henosepilachna vigintioctopunctata TaxID=420089 RepID=A0AAW1UDD9_9CUCU